MITDIGHAAFAAHDLDRALEFYALLGIREAFRLNREDGSLMLIYLHVAGDRFIEVFPGGPPPDPKRESGTPQDREQEERRRQLLKLLAEIEKRINDENARPKKRYISPATREEVYAVYYDRLRRRIEERGTRDFPEYQGKKLYGELTMNVTIDAVGRVVEADIVYPSKSRFLDRRAIAIVHAASPFGAFTQAMRTQADQIVVTSRFRFTREEGLETTPLSAVPQQ